MSNYRYSIKPVAKDLGDLGGTTVVFQDRWPLVTDLVTLICGTFCQGKVVSHGSGLSRKVSLYLDPFSPAAATSTPHIERLPNIKDKGVSTVHTGPGDRHLEQCPNQSEIRI